MNTQKLLQRMLDRDAFSAWLGIEIIEVKPGYAKLRARLREDMTNGVGSIHGGITFSLADSAFAFSCNMYNNISVSLDVHISFTKAAQVGDILEIESREIISTKRTGVYDIQVRNQREELVALFKGTCFRTGKPLIVEEDA